MNESKTLWLTGLPASGKSTLAKAVSFELARLGKPAFIVDGDELRSGLSQDLGFSNGDRRENVRRAAHIASLCNQQGIYCLVALVSPISADRELARSILGKERFVEVHLAASVDVCEQRDPKGNYARARSGAIPSFTGVGGLYEAPRKPALALDTGRLTVPQAVDLLLNLL